MAESTSGSILHMADQITGVFTDAANQLMLMGLALEKGLNTRILAEFYRVWALDQRERYESAQWIEQSGAYVTDTSIEAFRAMMQPFKPQESKAAEAVRWLQYNYELISWVSLFWLCVIVALVWGLA